MNFHNLDQFTQAYVECLLWASNDESDPETGGDPLEDNYDWEDMSPELQAQIIEDCKKFQEENAELLSPENYVGSRQYKYIEVAGHDFFLTRNCHGAGFWDGAWANGVEDKLTENSHAYGEFNVYVGDDGMLYC